MGPFAFLVQKAEDYDDYIEVALIKNSKFSGKFDRLKNSQGITLKSLDSLKQVVPDMEVLVRVLVTVVAIASICKLSFQCSWPQTQLVGCCLR